MRDFLQLPSMRGNNIIPFAIVLGLVCLAPGCLLAGDALAIVYPDFKPFHYKTEEGALKGFFFDIVIEWPRGAYPDIYAAGVGDRIVETDVSLQSMPFHLLISKRSVYRKILPRFNAMIREMIADGTMERILSRHFSDRM